MLLGHLRQYCLATRHCDRSAVVVSCSECEQASWIWPWMRAVIAISSVEAAASVVALVLLFLVCTKQTRAGSVDFTRNCNRGMINDYSTS